MTLCSAQGVTLSVKKAGVANVSEADRDAVEAGEDFWSMSGEFLYRHHVTPREQLCVPKESSFLFSFEVH